MRAKIGITTVLDSTTAVEKIMVGMEYVNSIIKTEGMPLMLPFTVDETVINGYVEACDGFLFCGGIDITPSKYGANPSPQLGATSLRLDDFHLILMKKVIAARKPFIGICRGTQILNVTCGGTLYQDSCEIPGTIMKHVQQTDRGDVCHPVTTVPGTMLSELLGETFWTNSYHHQSVKDLGRGLRIAAKTDDGVIEAIELEDYPYGLGIQWHPEVMFKVAEDMRPLFEGLIEAAK